MKMRLKELAQLVTSHWDFKSPSSWSFHLMRLAKCA